MAGEGGELTAILLKKTAEEGGENDKLDMKEKVWRESKKLWVVAAPAIFTRFSTSGVSLISQAFIGHLGPTELAAYSITLTVLLRFSNGILLGMASALETLCGQAYGAKQYHMLGIYLQRSWLVLIGSTICLTPIYIFAGPILLALGQEERLVRIARVIALWVIGINFSFVPSFTCQMFLQAQSKNKIIAYVAAISLGVHVFLSWLLMVHFDFGIAGAMTSSLVAHWLPNIAQLLYVICGGCKDTWRGFSWFAFKDLWPVFKLSLASGGMTCLEVWYNSILILLTGNLKNAEVSLNALAICININALEMMVACGFMAAASVRVSNEIGSGNSKGAKFATMIVVLTSLSVGVILFFVFLFLSGRVSYIFTTSELVAAQVADLSPILAFSILLNSVQPVLSGVAVGGGWQKYVTYVNLACYYLVGIPTGIFLGYVVDLQVKGVWLGMIFGILVQTCVLTIMSMKTDWDKQVSVSQRSLNRWVEPESRGRNQTSPRE